ncbi:MAG TPA: hypothetical protein VGG39_05885 [Polyangiaceae bacterium]|jgi:hypothetical protein
MGTCSALCIAALSYACSGGDGGSGTSAACQNLAANASCPAAPAGECLGSGGDCTVAALPTGLACSGDEICTMLVDPCPPLTFDSPTSGYGCACVGGRWACDECAPSAAVCMDAGGSD